jgi:hypothetical protein
MAVLVEATSVIILAESLLNKFPGGWEAFEKIVPNRTMCADNEIVRVGFMTPQDVESFVKTLELNGLKFLRGNEAMDIAVADQRRGLTSKCSWLEFGHVNLDGKNRVAACRMVDSQVSEIVTPLGWKFEGSLSSTYNFVPAEHLEKGMKYLRHENGLDVYLNPITGEEVYVGRTG